MKYKIEIAFENRIYGGLPKAKNLLTKFVEAKGEIPEETLEEKEEVLDLEESLEIARTGFRRSEDGSIFIRDFQIVACMKQAVQVMGFTKSKRGTKSVIEAALRIRPREIPLVDVSTGAVFTEPTGMEELQGRVMTMQGPRSILSEKEYIEGAGCTFTLEILVNTPQAKELGKAIPEIMEVMQNIGLGSVRSRQEGKFLVTSCEKDKAA